MNRIGTKNKQNQTVNEDTTCYVYAKMKWMRTFKAFDLDGFFPGKLIFASLLLNSEENRRKLQQLAEKNSYAQWQFQLRNPATNKVLFETVRA